MVDMHGEPLCGATDARLDPRLEGIVRMEMLARSALDEMMEKVNAASATRPEVTLLLGLAEPRFNWAEVHVTALEKQLLVRRGPGWKARSLPSGHASAIDALGHAVSAVHAEPGRLCIVGGVDSYFDPGTLLWLDGHRRLASKENRSGFAPGEAAAFVAVASDRLRRTLALPSLAVVEHVHSSVEKVLNRMRAPGLGHGLSRAIRTVTESLPRGVRVDDVYCDINGERYRTEEWGFAVLRSQARLGKGGVYKTAVAELGDVGAATGGLLAVLAVQAWQRGYASGPRSLLWASSEMGLRAAAVLRHPGSD